MVGSPAKPKTSCGGTNAHLSIPLKQHRAIGRSGCPNIVYRACRASTASKFVIGLIVFHSFEGPKWTLRIFLYLVTLLM